MARRRLNAEEKLQLVIESFRGNISIAELCRQVDVWPTELHRFRARALEGALEALKNSRARKKDPEKGHLRKQLEKMKQIIVTQAEEIDLLKKRPTRTIRSN